MAFQVMGIAVLLIFYGCYFGKMLAQRKKGIRTDQMGRGKTGHEKWIEITLKLAACLTALAEAVSILLNTSLFPVWVRAAGALTGSAGVLVFVISVAAMKDNWRAGVAREDDTELVTSGIYRISRNPAFLGFDLVYVGIGLMFFNWALFAVSVAGAVMFHLQIVYVEEACLSRTFGDEYTDYRKRVCRYLGRKGMGSR